MKFRRSLFWDTDLAKIDPKKNARYIIERILEFGNEDEVRWVWQNYSPKFIKHVMNKSRGVLHRKSKALWSLILK